LIEFKAKTGFVNLTVEDKVGLKTLGVRKVECINIACENIKRNSRCNLQKKKTSLACLDENEKYIFYKKYILYPIGPDR
jgi:hypothetical protein